ncbi:hypothetical protein [Phycicoccus sp. SLBN-51]|uniref:hypothetical protein n=1 Tax=Phycicoccus sp. SLBN-51 TaxID=2768447 RepID=UPI001357CDF9|nr:hypothetical protein [Phycicoccus sp. SLBN-51]
MPLSFSTVIVARSDEPARTVVLGSVMLARIEPGGTGATGLAGAGGTELGGAGVTELGGAGVTGLAGAASGKAP